jgi:hypothetical protein
MLFFCSSIFTQYPVWRLGIFYGMQCNHKILVPVVPVSTEGLMKEEQVLLGEIWFNYWIPQAPCTTDVANVKDYQHQLGNISGSDGVVSYLTVFCLPQCKTWRRPNNENEALYHDVFYGAMPDSSPLEWFGNAVVVKHTKDGHILDLNRDDGATVDKLMRK